MNYIQPSEIGSAAATIDGLQHEVAQLRRRCDEQAAAIVYKDQVIDELRATRDRLARELAAAQRQARQAGGALATAEVAAGRLLR